MPLTILVVDDDLGTRLAIGDYLELAGYTVVTAENGQAALNVIQQYQPQLIVTDITMPVMNGYELVREVRRQPGLRLLPVVFLTEHSQLEDRVRGYQLGGDVFLPKPFELSEIGAVVRNLLDRSQLIESAWRQRLQSLEPVLESGGDLPAQPSRSPPDLPKHSLQFELTPREREVLIGLAAGLSNAQIGDRLHLSPRTVEKYVSSLFRKTTTVNRAELVRFAIERRLVD